MDPPTQDTEKGHSPISGAGLDRSRDQHIDVLNISPDSRLLDLAGVKSVSSLSESTTRIYYDPHVVGARDLLEHGFAIQPSLAPEDTTSTLVAERRALRALIWKTLLSILLTIPVLVLAWLPDSGRMVLQSSIALFFASLLQFLAASVFYSSAYIAIFRNHVADADVLITLSTTTAYVFSVVAYAFQVLGRPLETGMFFQSSALLTTIVLIARLVAEYSQYKAMESVSIRSLQPQTTILMLDDENQAVVDARLLHYGDTIKVLPDSHISTDGIVTSGISEVDESMVTGEAELVLKRSGSRVIAGSLNHQGVLLVSISRLPGENTINQIAEMTDEALLSTIKSRQIADRVAAWFVPGIVLLFLATFAIWLAVGRVIPYQSWSDIVVTALTYAIAVLIVSCPCAIVLAVPMVLVIASGIAAKHGIIIKSGRTIEIARRVDHVVFDKTGTLTEGKPVVTHCDYLHESPDLIRRILLGLLSSSNHPVSKSIVHNLDQNSVKPETIEKLTVSTGNGVSGEWHGRTVRGGNPCWLGVEGHNAVEKISAEGCTVFCLTLDGELAAVVGLQDRLRKEASDAVTRLQQRNIDVSLVSGDSPTAVDRVGRMLGIPLENIRSRATPSDKQSYICSLLSKPTSSGGTSHLLFCGDGTNDSVALAQATIGVYMSGGTDIAKGAADVVLASPNLLNLLLLVDISKAAFRRIILNFTWSLLYNVFALLLAAGAFKNSGFRLEPQFAAIGELVSIVPVILIAFQLKLKRWKM